MSTILDREILKRIAEALERIAEELTAMRAARPSEWERNAEIRLARR